MAQNQTSHIALAVLVCARARARGRPLDPLTSALVLSCPCVRAFLRMYEISSSSMTRFVRAFVLMLGQAGWDVVSGRPRGVLTAPIH